MSLISAVAKITNWDAPEFSIEYRLCAFCSRRFTGLLQNGLNNRVS
jgi:hypothetical protein